MSPAALALPGGRAVGARHRRMLSRILFVSGVIPVVLMIGAFAHLAYEGGGLPSSADVASLLVAARAMLFAGFLVLLAGLYECSRGRRPSGLLR